MLIALLLSVSMLPLCPQQKPQDPAALVPADTIIYFGTQSVRAAALAGRASAMQMILSEKEVQAFLQKPLTAADKSLQDMVKSSGLPPEAGVSKFSLSELVNGSTEGPPLGRMFLAVTHVDLAPLQAAKPSFPDVGLIAGMELLNTDDIGMLKALWAQIPLPEESASYNGHTYVVKSQPDKGLTVSLAFLGNLAVASLSDKTLKAAIDRFDGKAPAGSSLADAADYRKLLATAGGFPADASSTLVHIGPLVDLAHTALTSGLMKSSDLADLAPKIAIGIDSLGLKALKFAGSVSFRDKDGKIQNTSVLAVDKDAGGLIPRCMTASKPVDIGRVKGVPGNTLGMTLTSIDSLPEIYDFLMTTFQTVDANDYATFQAKLKEIMGERDLRADVVANIGGTLLTFALPGEGMPGTPTTVARIGVKNATNFVDAFKAILKGLSGMFSSSEPVTVTDSMHDDKYPFYELDLSKTPAAMLMWQPAFAIDGNEIVASQSSKTLKSALNGNAGEGSLADNKEFMAFATGLARQGALHELSFSDNAKEFGAMYGQVAGAAQMFGGGLGDLPVDLALMPSEQAISKHLGPTYEGTVSTDGGGTYVSRGVDQFELGDFVPLALTTGVLVAANVGHGHADATPKEVDPKEKVQEDLAQISAGMTVYKLTAGHYPTAIDDLVKPLPDYPDGCLGKAQAPVDPWGHAYNFRLNEKGKPFLWSSGPDGVDQQGAGDDITKR